MSPDADKLAAFADAISHDGWASYPDFLPQSLCLQLADEIHAARNAGVMTAAGVGRGERFQVNPTIRTDWISWLDDAQLSAPQQDAWEALSAVRLTLNRTLYLGLRHLEAHLTAYLPGGHYAKHVDNFHGTSARVVSCLVYLNQAWAPSDGGELQIFSPHDDMLLLAEIPPRSGTLACFLSREIPHAVKATARERLSLTGWFR